MRSSYRTIWILSTMISLRSPCSLLPTFSFVSLNASLEIDMMLDHRTRSKVINQLEWFCSWLVPKEFWLWLSHGRDDIVEDFRGSSCSNGDSKVRGRDWMEMGVNSIIGFMSTGDNSRLLAYWCDQWWISFHNPTFFY